MPFTQHSTQVQLAANTPGDCNWLLWSSLAEWEVPFMLGKEQAGTRFSPCTLHWKGTGEEGLQQRSSQPHYASDTLGVDGVLFVIMNYLFLNILKIICFHWSCSELSSADFTYHYKIILQLLSFKKKKKSFVTWQGIAFSRHTSPTLHSAH